MEFRGLPISTTELVLRGTVRGTLPNGSVGSKFLEQTDKKRANHIGKSVSVPDFKRNSCMKAW